jgi:hypothetical protein
MPPCFPQFNYYVASEAQLRRLSCECVFRGCHDNGTLEVSLPSSYIFGHVAQRRPWRPSRSPPWPWPLRRGRGLQKPCVKKSNSKEFKFIYNKCIALRDILLRRQTHAWHGSGRHVTAYRVGSSSRFYGVSGKMSERLFTYFMGVSFTKPMEML